MLLLEQRIAAHKVAFVQFDDPAKARFEGRDVFADLVAVQRHGRLQPQGVPGAQPAGDDAELSAGSE